MKVKSSKAKGQRIFKLKGNRRPYWIEPTEDGWWFDTKIGQWTKTPEFGYGELSSSYYSMKCHGYKNCKSFKAALNLIRKWDVPIGTEFRVSLPWIGYGFKVTK